MTAAVNAQIKEILLDAETIRRRVKELGQQITRDYAGKDLLLVGLLKGAVVFLADLAREVDLPVEIDFMAISSYGTRAESSGVVRILKDLDENIEGRHVLVVEDIVDSGLTLEYILSLLRARNPASLRVCALLRKQKAGAKPVQVDYVGFEIPDRFVVGYGLDYAQAYRNLPYVAVLEVVDRRGVRPGRGLRARSSEDTEWPNTGSETASSTSCC
ncbi:MAG: hypoxanthine phosphoribosyltransferase [Chloroflexota bacterium]